MMAEVCIESGILSAAKPKDGFGGFILRQNGQEIPKIGPIKQANDKYSNLLILKMALQMISPQCDEILIHTSSDYIYFNLVSVNLIQWEKNHWKKSNGEEIKYKNEWQIVASCLKGKKMRVKLNANYKGKAELKAAIKAKMKKG